MLTLVSEWIEENIDKVIIIFINVLLISTMILLLIPTVFVVFSENTVNIQSLKFICILELVMINSWFEYYRITSKYI